MRGREEDRGARGRRGVPLSRADARPPDRGPPPASIDTSRRALGVARSAPRSTLTQVVSLVVTRRTLSVSGGVHSVRAPDDPILDRGTPRPKGDGVNGAQGPTSGL